MSGSSNLLGIKKITVILVLQLNLLTTFEGASVYSGKGFYTRHSEELLHRSEP